MITKSTPWSITWAEDDNSTITFQGEWTLESKFYLIPTAFITWDNSKTTITETQLRNLLKRIQLAALARGWIIEIDDLPIR